MSYNNKIYNMVIVLLYTRTNILKNRIKENHDLSLVRLSVIHK